MQTPLPVDKPTARRFLIQQFGLMDFQTMPDVLSAVRQLEFVQEDSINVCGRMHDLILRNRVQDYTPDLLHEALYTSPRQAFEYYFPNLCVLPATDYPYFMRVMQESAAVPGRWGGLLPDEIPVADAIFLRLDTEGPLRTRSALGKRSSTLGTEHGYTISGWGTRQTMVSRVADKLWTHGCLSIARRENFERWFDRTERLFPEATTMALPDETEERAYRARKKLRAMRLFRRKPDLFAALPVTELLPVEITGDTKLWYILAEDRDALLSAADVAPTAPPMLLAPLDPLIYDRERNRIVWDFDYTWEVYTPAEKRKWGYYVLPILYGDKIIGRVDPKLDRPSCTLKINALYFEARIDQTVMRPLIRSLLEELGRFLGASGLSGLAL